MHIKKTKLTLVLTGALFLLFPMSQVYAHEAHCDIKETELGETMKHIKSELRAYVKGFKKSDEVKMKKYLNELLALSDKANHYTPVKISKMNHDDMKQMDHSKMDMSETDHSKMGMSEMDHSKMGMSEMDHSKMGMSEMDHSKMDHGNTQMGSSDHDMSTMPSMKGMSNEQNHQHMLYMQGMKKLQDLFNALNRTKDKAQIKIILGEIKEHSRKSHQQFRQDCP